MQITFGTAHPTSHRIMNRLFRTGYIVGIPETGEVVGVYVPRLLGSNVVPPETLKQLPTYDPAELPVTTFSIAPASLWFRLALRFRYPNCRVYVLGEGRPHQQLSKARAAAVRLYVANNH